MNGARAELTVHRARTAALAGNLDEAGQLLAEAEPTAAVLDLRARVHAQRGELTEADECWAQVQQLTPEDPAAATGRKMIEKIQAGRRRPRPVVTAGRGAAAAFVLVCAVLAGSAAWLDQDEPIPVAREQHELRDYLAAQDRERAATAGDRAKALAAIAETLTMPGVVVEQRTDDVRLVLEAGLFGGDATTVNTPGAALLAEIGRRLATLTVKTTVVGHAAMVPGGPNTGGAAIALARAQSAAEHLSTAGGLPLTAFTLVSADQRDSPYPDPARSRTVTLLIAPSHQG